jgi:hypothetical protein
MWPSSLARSLTGCRWAPRSAARGSAGSTSTSHACVRRWRPCSPWRRHPAASPWPSWPPRSSGRPGRPTLTTAPVRPPTPSRSCAASTWSSNPPGHGATTPTRGAAHHHRPAGAARPGHRPILAGVRVPRRGRKPATWTRTDRHCEALGRQMNALFNDLGIAASPASQRQHLVEAGPPSRYCHWRRGRKR